MSKTTKGVMAFLVGWIGSYTLSSKVFHYTPMWLSIGAIFCGLVLAGIFTGAYSEEVKENKKEKGVDE